MIDALTGNTKKKGKKEEKTEVVEKVKEDNSEKFNTVASTENVDEPLIKAMIDRTTKAREGTRLRFKLLDDVTSSRSTSASSTTTAWKASMFPSPLSVR